MNVEYRITNLAEMIEVARLIQAEVDAHAGHAIDPSTIYIASKEWVHVDMRLEEATLTDGSHVYNVTAS